MSADQPCNLVHIGDGRTFSRVKFFSILHTYNCFLEEKTQLQLNVHENRAGQVTLEGFLAVSWGMKRPIRLKIQDEKQTLQSDSPQSTSLSPEPISPLGNKRGMTRWGEVDNLNYIDELEEILQDGSETFNSCAAGCSEYDSSTLRTRRPRAIIEDTSILFRTRSDASLVHKRVKSKTAEEKQRDRQHRFSINGHFYNYKTSIFTPSYGATTNVRISSRMKTHEVIVQLLHKFKLCRSGAKLKEQTLDIYKIENDPSEFALYCIHQSGERRKLSSTDFPLWERFLQGPSENIMRIFLMDTDEEEVSLDVAQYVNLDLPILHQVLLKLQEEENQEIQHIISKFRKQHSLLSHCLNSKMASKTETAV